MNLVGSLVRVNTSGGTPCSGIGELPLVFNGEEDSFSDFLFGETKESLTLRVLPLVKGFSSSKNIWRCTKIYSPDLITVAALSFKCSYSFRICPIRIHFIKFR